MNKPVFVMHSNWKDELILCHRPTEKNFCLLVIPLQAVCAEDENIYF